MFVTHQSHNVPGVTAAEGLAEAEGNGDHNEDKEGAEIRPQVFLHGAFDHAREGEHAHHTEGEQQLDGQDAEDLQKETAKELRHSICRTAKPRAESFKQAQDCSNVWPVKWKILDLSPFMDLENHPACINPSVQVSE